MGALGTSGMAGGSMSTIDMMVRPSAACLLSWAAREMLPLGRIRCDLLGVPPDLAVEADAVDLTVLDRVMLAVEADLSVLDREMPEMGAARLGLLPDLTVLAREDGRCVGVLVPVGSGDPTRRAVTVL